jgi:hypothetical protein
MCPAAERSIEITTLYSDAATDTTHFRSDFIPWLDNETSADSMAKVPSRTDLLPASSIGYLRLPAGYRSDWHPAPRKQYVMVLRGTAEVEAGDGERRTFTAGTVVLVTDVQGRGHRTNVIGKEDVFLVWVPIP